jgi:adhesin/invasin
VQVRDLFGNGVSGVSVTFTVTAGAGVIAPASPAVVVTDANGNAALTTWTLGASLGTNTVTAAAAGLTGSPVSFNATATAGAPTTIAANSVTTQSAIAGTAVAAPPSVLVTDAGNNPVAGVSVTFAVTAGGGAISPASPATVSTNASGIATLTSWTLGATVGANSVTASVAGLAGSPVTFTRHWYCGTCRGAGHQHSTGGCCYRRCVHDAACCADPRCQWQYHGERRDGDGGAGQR